MHLAHPWALASLALAIPLVALYLRRRHRARVEVSSLTLWRAAHADLARRAGLRRLRHELSLALHLTALGLAALALASPTRRARAAPAARLVVVLDTTASMAARDGDATRFERARALAARALRDAAPGTELALVEAGCEPAHALVGTRDPEAALRALARLAPRDCGGDLSRALALAVGRARGARDHHTLVVTDGVTRADALEAALPGRVELALVGRDAPNVGVTALALRPAPGATDPGATHRRASLLVGLTAAGAGAREVTVTAALLRGDDAETVAVRRARVAAGRSSLTLPVELRVDADAALLRVALTPPPDDALAADDVAWSPVPAGDALPVRLVVPRDGDSPWIARALRADPDVRLTALTRDAWLRARDDGFEGLTVFHGTAPEEAVAGEALAFERADLPGPPAMLGVALGARAPRPRWTDVSPTDPRVRFVGVADVHLASARRIRSAPNDLALVTSPEGPLVVARDTARGSSTVAAFDPDRSDWPLRPGFVLFLRAAVEHARARASGLGHDARRTGAPARIPSRGDLVRVRGPDGARALPVRDGVATWRDTSRAGVYALDRGRGDERLALSLLDATESGLARAAIPWRGHAPRTDDAPPWEPRDLGWLAALAAALAVTVEWVLHTGARWKGRDGVASARGPV